MYVKMFRSILDSSLAEDRRLRHFFMDLLLLADSNGDVKMTKGAISRQIGATVDEVNWGITELMKPDPISRTQDFEGRRLIPLEGHGYGWRILNYGLYRGWRDVGKIREDTARRVKKCRELKKAKALGLPGLCERCGCGDHLTEHCPDQPSKGDAAGFKEYERAAKAKGLEYADQHLGGERSVRVTVGRITGPPPRVNGG